MNRNVILAIIAIIFIAVVGLFVFSQFATIDGKVNTQISILSQSTLKNGDHVEFELKDAQGNALSEKNITIAYDDGSGLIQYYKIFTDQNGKGYLTLDGENAGQYDVTVTFDGDDKYGGSSDKQTLTIEEGTSESNPITDSNSTANTVLYNNGTSSSSSSRNASSQLFYDAELNVYYDAGGKVIGGQGFGDSVYELNMAESPLY